jgi:D-alanine-D-alanine ligase-like ATP-grasp enzyme
MGSAIGMDKLRTKRLAQAVGHPDHRLPGAAQPRPTSTIVSSGSACRLIVKPADARVPRSA